MNRTGYLKLILTFLTILVAIFGFLVISALDRIIAGQEALQRQLNLLQQSMKELSANPVTTAAPATPGITERSAVPLLANQEFFDQQAPSGGSLRRAISSEVENLNSLLINEATVAQFNALCSNSLAERNYAHPEIFQPMLAESWSASEDGKCYKIKLRKGILWHDFTDPVTGKRWENVEVKAQDFKFYVDVIKNPEVNAAPLRSYLQDLEGITVLNDYEFEVKWNSNYFKTLELTLGLTPLPRHLYMPDGTFDPEQFNNDHERNRIIVGCGPYQFVRWDKGQQIIFERFEKYFGKQYNIMPPLKTLTFEVMPHPNTRFQALLAGELDLLGLTPEQYLNRTNSAAFAKEGGSLDKYRYLNMSYSYIGYNLENELFADKRVRQAMTMLVNREKIRKDIYQDLAEIVTGPFYPNSAEYHSGLTPWPFDIERARQLLAEAGWQDSDQDGILDKDGKKFEFSMMQIADHPIQQRMMPLIREDMAKAGIMMHIDIFEWSVYLQKLKERSYDACSLGWTSTYDPDPFQVWHSSQADFPEGSNHVNFRNARADELIESLRQEQDNERRLAIYREFQELLHEEQPYTFLFAPYSLTAISRQYGNVQIFDFGIATSVLYSNQAAGL